MALSDSLASQFAKISQNDTKKKKESSVYGTVVDYNGSKYVRFDGSELPTPVSYITGIEVDDRVTVSIRNHTATVTGNLTSPSATQTELDKKISVIKADAERIDSLESEVEALQHSSQATSLQLNTLEQLISKYVEGGNKDHYITSYQISADIIVTESAVYPYETVNEEE